VTRQGLVEIGAASGVMRSSSFGSHDSFDWRIKTWRCAEILPRSTPRHLGIPLRNIGDQNRGSCFIQAVPLCFSK